MNSETKHEPSLVGSDITVPLSIPPRMDGLQSHVDRRRRRRALVRCSATGAALLALVVVTIAFTPDQDTPSKPAVPVLIAASSGHNADALSRVTKLPVVPNVTAPHVTAPNAPPKIKLYAKLSRPVPVFSVDQATQQIFHVGWAESQQRVPVDMNYVPHQQQEMYNTVLTSDGWDFTL